ncbi:MAG: conserved membrane protein of unknown function [Promethearchaeota archaeon]|nr:MAG: conserved membrane protein of unknown function [Candidatus Lokiarchaeota archaeon]
MRLAIGVVVGLVLSFFSVSLFDQWNTLSMAVTLGQYNFFSGISTLLSANFEFNLIGFFASGPCTIPGFFQPAFLSCLFLGFLSGVIVQGIKRGMIGSFLVIIITLLMWIIFSIFSGQDLMSIFTGTQLIETIGGILGALLAGVGGGLLGGYLGGPYEEEVY